ncbi:MAG TPA: metallophosphoesterase family protein [Kofleriaceae bacterium]|nr:metallophosphoesterase family protein [Kofleriaceae bacterium]
MSRTFVIGDIHGDLEQLDTLLGRLPALAAGDTLVFLGDYVDRGPCSRQVVERVRALQTDSPAHVVTLRGNHEDAWLRVADKGWPEFLLPEGNGCLACMRSYTGAPWQDGDAPTPDELRTMMKAAFYPADVVDWFRALPHWFENEHAIYVHAGLPDDGAGGWQHPDQVVDRDILLWIRTKSFFTDYRGKPVVVGHTVTETLPAEYSSYTPDDPGDLWAGEGVIAIDTGCGKGGFLTAVELPARVVYESR